MAILNGDGVGHTGGIDTIVTIVHGVVLQQSVALDAFTLNIQVPDDCFPCEVQKRLAALVDGQGMTIAIQCAAEGIQISAHIRFVIGSADNGRIPESAHRLPVCRQGHIRCHFEINAVKGNTGVHLVPHGCKARRIPQDIRIVRCAAAGDTRLRSPFTGLHGDGDAGFRWNGGGDFGS